MRNTYFLIIIIQQDLGLIIITVYFACRLEFGNYSNFSCFDYNIHSLRSMIHYHHHNITTPVALSPQRQSKNAAGATGLASAAPVRAIASSVGAITSAVEAIASAVEAVASAVEAVASAVGAVAKASLE